MNQFWPKFTQETQEWSTWIGLTFYFFLLISAIKARRNVSITSNCIFFCTFWMKFCLVKIFRPKWSFIKSIPVLGSRPSDSGWAPMSGSGSPALKRSARWQSSPPFPWVDLMKHFQSEFTNKNSIGVEDKFTKRLLIAITCPQYSDTIFSVPNASLRFVRNSRNKLCPIALYHYTQSQSQMAQSHRIRLRNRKSKFGPH
jgi:hypothetical protein